MKGFVALFLALVVVASFAIFLRPAETGHASTAAPLPELKPQYVQAAAAGISPKVSSIAGHRDFAGKKVKDPAEETVIRPSDQKNETAEVPGVVHDPDGAPASPSLLPMPTPSLSFDGIYNTQNGETYSLFFIPSDTNGDVGQSHYVQATNALLRMYDKSGNPVTPALRISDIFAPLGTLCSTRNDAQPVVLYDTLADRWLLSQYCQAFAPFRQMVAVSQTGDPTGAWYLYEFVMPNNRLNDYTKFGVWWDGYYMSDDEFVGDEFRGNGFFAFDRQKMLSGDPTAGYIYFNMPSPVTARLSSFLPADLDGLRPPPLGEPNIFVTYSATEYGQPQDAIRLFNFHADFQNPALSTFTERAGSPLAVAAFDPTSPTGRGDIPVPSPGEPLDSESDRLMYRVAYRNFGTHRSLIVNQTVRMTQVGLPYRAGVRLYELRSTGSNPFEVVEQSTLSDPVSSLWMAGAAQDHQGNIAAEYSIADTQKAPSIEYQGRLASEPAGTFRTPGTLVAGTGVQTAFGFRWGDYTGMTVDPVDDCTFWMTNQYYTAESQNESPFSWLTRIGKFKFAECTAAPRGAFTGTVTNAITGQPIAGATVTATLFYRRDTDAAGSYGNLYVLPNIHTLTASAKGYASQMVSASVVNGQVVTLNFQLQPIPEIGSTGASVAAETCAANQAPDPGETVTMNITLRNTGAADAQNLTATLLRSGGVLNPGPAQNYGALPVNGAGVSRPFTFRIAPGVGCGGTVTLTLSLMDGAEPRGTVSIPLTTGKPKIAFQENFDRVARPNLPSGWTTSATGAQIIWTSSNSRPVSLPNSIFSPDPNQVGLNEVVSPSFAISSSQAKISFKNWYELETTFLRNRLYDGAVLEIKIGSADWQDILQAGGAFETGGYDDGLIDACCQNPLAGRRGWSGRSGVNQAAEFITSRAKLPVTAAGQNVQFRWRVGTDIGTFREGMYVDDVLVTDGSTCACGNFAPTRAPFDFDGDGKTDLSVFRPTDTPGAPDFSYRNSSNNALQNTPWGSAGDRAAVADFDGDGKADVAVFRPSEGNWYALRSSDAAVIALHFGAAEDKPVPADYDGDGRADIAVFRPSEGNWYYLRSSDGQFFGGHWGANGDLPVQDDYDGDAKADLAVFRPSDGAWYVLGSTQGFFAQHFGLAGDKPVAGDFDGDGKADFTVFRPSDRTWYLLRSDQGFTAVAFGLASDTPLQADLDGDGSRDIAVYRAPGDWFYLRSSDNGFAAGNFGEAGDTPLPSVYIDP